MRSKKAIKNILVSLLLQFVTIICGFIVPRMIIESFGSNVNGLISSITQFLGYITLLESGFGPVVKATLYKPIAQKDKKQIANILKSSEKFFKTIAIIFLIYIVILSGLYPILLVNEFDKIFTISLVLIIAISTFAEYYFGMTYRLYLQAEQKTYVVSGIQIITTILNTISVVVLIKLGTNIQLVKLFSSLIFVFRPIAQNLYVKRVYNINLNEANNDFKIEQKWDGLAQHIAAVVHNNTDIAILTFLSNMAEVSVYSVYLLVVTGVKKVVSSFTGGIDASFGDMLARKEYENLNKKFRLYETFYFTIITIIFTCTFILIVPFVTIYTNGIQDVNYIRPLFAVLLVLAEFTHSIRLPYSSLVLSAGHFKETRIGAWVEAGVNIILSIILVFKFGIIGVAIGTFVAMFIRTVEFMIHSSKKILNRSVWCCIKRVLIVIGQVLFVVFIVNIINIKIEMVSYLNWFIYAVIVFIISSVIVILGNSIGYKSDFKEAINVLKMVKNKEH